MPLEQVIYKKQANQLTVLKFIDTGEDQKRVLVLLKLNLLKHTCWFPELSTQEHRGSNPSVEKKFNYLTQLKFFRDILYQIPYSNLQ